MSNIDDKQLNLEEAAVENTSEESLNSENVVEKAVFDLEKPAEERKLLFKITNLTKYFPLKRQFLSNVQEYVHAVESISLDIYEGETLGLVGESGCGKSTFGRTILQIYPSTAGSIQYYGATLGDVNAKYVFDAIKSIPERYSSLEAASDKLEALVNKVVELKSKEGVVSELAKTQEELLESSRHYEEHYADIVRIAGGLLVADDLEKVSAMLLDSYEADVAYCKVKNEIADLRLQAEADPSTKSKNLARIDSLEPECARLEKVKLEKEKALDELRESLKDKPKFEELEAGRDEGINLSKLSTKEMRPLRQDIQIIFQDPYSSLDTRMTLGNIIGEGVLAHGIFESNSSEEYNQYIQDIMQECGLAPYFIHRYPHQFSGGQRQRIGIARALALQPKFVVCDEAVSALDVSIQSQVINLLGSLKEQRNLTYLFITHDLSVVKYISDRIAVMYLGEVSELASSDKLFKKPLHPYTQALLRAIPRADIESGTQELSILSGDVPSAVRPPSGCRFHTRCDYCMEECKKFEPLFQEVEPDHFVACHLMNMQEEERAAYMAKKDAEALERQKTEI